MISRRSVLTIAVAFWQAASTDAFQTNVATPVVALYRQQPQRTAATLNHHSHLTNQDDTCDQNAKEPNRRTFLKQLSTAMALTPLLLPTLAFAEEEENTETTTIDKVETLIKEESELDADVVREEEDEKISIDDEKKLIDELEKEITVEESDSSTSEEVEVEEDKVKGETEALIKEEEQLKSETEDMITKIEAMESEVQSLDAEDKSDGDDATTEKTSEAFVDKLKERVEQKEDLISMLKRQSEKDIDPKTGKFKTMKPEEYKERVKSTDVDFIQFLKDTVANEQEWEKDLGAFEGFLDKQFGPTVKELQKDLKPFVGEVEKEVAPVVGDAMQQLKEKAGSAVDGEVEDLKKRAGDLVGKLRSIF